MKPKIWNLGWSYNEADYKANLLDIERYDQDVYEEVMKANPEKWCRHSKSLDLVVKTWRTTQLNLLTTPKVKPETSPLYLCWR